MCISRDHEEAQPIQADLVSPKEIDMTTAAYTVREITDARAMANAGMASFASMEAAVAWVNENFDVLAGEEFDGEYDGIIRPKGKPFSIPTQINIAAI